MTTVDKIIYGVCDREGGEYTNDPNDSGGPTKWGITIEPYQRYVGAAKTITAADIQALTRDDAYKIYLDIYVTKPWFDKVVAQSELIGAELIDSGVNCGVGTAGLWLQRVLNALNREGKDYPDVKLDGQIGQKTIDSLAAFLKVRNKPLPVHFTEGEIVLWRYLNALQGVYYISVSEKRVQNEEFVFGWGLNRLGGSVQ